MKSDEYNTLPESDRLMQEEWIIVYSFLRLQSKILTSEFNIKNCVVQYMNLPVWFTYEITLDVPHCYIIEDTDQNILFNILLVTLCYFIYSSYKLSASIGSYDMLHTLIQQNEQVYICQRE